MRAPELAGRLKRLLFPARCVVCGKVTPDGGDFCSICDLSGEYISADCCELCGEEKKNCACKGRKNHFEKLCAPFYYRGSVKEMVRNFKFRGKQWLREPLSRYMAERAEEKLNVQEIDVVTCVPFTKKQLRRRGYNQSGLLAEGVARDLGLPFDGELLVKLYDINAQHSMAKANRAGNVMGIFHVPCPEKVRGRTVLLCDDIKTTGATLDECSKMLILNGAYKVYGLCLAVAGRNEAGNGRQENWQD